MSKRNPSVLWSIGGGNQGLNGSERSNARKNIGVNFSDPSTTDAYSLEFLSNVNNSSGTADNITFTKKKVTVDGASYNASDPSTNPASSKTIKKAIETLSVSDITGFGKDKTLSALSESNGKISASFQSIELNLSAIKATTPDRSVVTDNSGNVVVNDLSTSTPSASGTATSFISAVTQNSIGKLSSISKANLPEASTSVKGIVQLGTTSSTAAAGDHSHGNITNGGALTSSVASASSQYLVITEASNNKVARSSLAFDTTNGSNKILKKTGAWGDFIGTSATTAAAGNHSHAVAVASTSGTGGSAGFMSAADKEKLDKLDVVSVTADYGKFIQTTAGTFSDSTDLVFSTFTLDEMQSTHITFNNGTITLAPGVYRIDVDLYASVPAAIICNSIGNINHVQIDYTYEHTVYAPIHNIRKYTVNTTYSVTIPHTQQMLNGTTITIPRMIITYIGDKA